MNMNLTSILLLLFVSIVIAPSTSTEDIQSALNKIMLFSKQLLDFNTQLSEQGVKIVEQTETIANQNVKIAELQNRIAEQDIKIANQDTVIANQNAKISIQDTKIANQQKTIADQDTKIANQEINIANQNVKIANQETTISNQNTNIAKLRMDIAMSPSEIARFNTNDENASNVSFHDLYNQMTAINMALTEKNNINTRMNQCSICHGKMDGIKTMLENLTDTVSKSDWKNWVRDTIKNESARCFGQCEDGWTRFRDHCYLFSMERQNWQTAMNYCRSLGSSLVDIADEEEDNFLSTTLTNIHSRDSNKGTIHYWTAGKKYQGTWLWSNTQNTIVYSHWAPNEPRQRQCLALWGKYNFSWDDIYCTDNRNFICKKLKR